MPTSGVVPSRTAIVTGGTGGLGSAVVERLLAEGWRLVVPWVDEREVDYLTPHANLTLLECDVTDEAAVGALLGVATGADAAPLRGLANLVGGYTAGSRVHEAPLDYIDAAMLINFRPTFLVTRAALPHMIDAGGGSIIGVATRAALSPFPGAAGYIVSKAAVWAFVQAVAVEYRGDRVRANAIFPTVIDTPGNRASQPDASTHDWVSPQDIASTVAFLLGDDSAAITGSQIAVPGVPDHLTENESICEVRSSL